MLEVDVPDVGVGRAQVLVEGPRRGGVALARDRRERPVLVEARRERHAEDRAEVEHGVIRRVLDDVEEHVAEVPVIEDAVAGAHDRLPVAEEVVGEADARGEVVVVRAVEAVLQVAGLVGRQVEAPGGELLEVVTALPEVEVRVEPPLVPRAVEHAEVLPPQARVERQARRDLEGVLGEPGRLVVAVVAREARRRERRRERLARELAPRVDRDLVGLERAVDEVLDRAEVGDRRLEGAEGAVVADVQVLAAELQAVAPALVAQRPERLVEVLRPAEGDRAPERRGRREVARAGPCRRPSAG